VLQQLREKRLLETKKLEMLQENSKNESVHRNSMKRVSIKDQRSSENSYSERGLSSKRHLIDPRPREMQAALVLQRFWRAKQIRFF
jgi:hypothetical protein